MLLLISLIFESVLFRNTETRYFCYQIRSISGAEMFTPMHQSGYTFQEQGCLLPLTLEVFCDLSTWNRSKSEYGPPPLSSCRLAAGECRAELANKSHLIDDYLRIVRCITTRSMPRRRLIKNDRTSVHAPCTTADTFLVHPSLYTRTPRGHLIHRPMTGWF